MVVYKLIDSCYLKSCPRLVLFCANFVIVLLRLFFASSRRCPGDSGAPQMFY